MPHLARSQRRGVHLPPMTCPQCGHGLEAGTFGICVCPACRGVWLTDEDLGQPGTHPGNDDDDDDDDDLDDAAGYEIIETSRGSYQLVRRPTASSPRKERR